MREDQDDVVDIYRNRKTGELRIQPFARTGHSSQPFGEQTVLQAHEVTAKLLKGVLENLVKNGQTKYVKELAPHRSETESKRSLKEDQLVSVVRCRGNYRIIPFRRMGNSMGSADGLETTVSEDEFLTKGTNLIQEAFNRVP
jgi:hypothetical protein